jgi:predicted phosphoribosyltransferase
MSDDDLSINAKNRHQYFKTVMRSASADEKNIQAAEARGRQRVAREEETKRKVTMVFRISLVLAVLVTAGYFAYRQFA